MCNYQLVENDCPFLTKALNNLKFTPYAPGSKQIIRIFVHPK